MSIYPYLGKDIEVSEAQSKGMTQFVNPPSPFSKNNKISKETRVLGGILSFLFQKYARRTRNLKNFSNNLNGVNKNELYQPLSNNWKFVTLNSNRKLGWY